MPPHVAPTSSLVTSLPVIGAVATARSAARPSRWAPVRVVRPRRWRRGRRRAPRPRRRSSQHGAMTRWGTGRARCPRLCRGSSPESLSRPTSRPLERSPAGSRTTLTTSRPSRTRPGRASSATRQPMPRSRRDRRRSCTFGSKAPRDPIVWFGPWRRSNCSCAIDRAGRRSCSTSRCPAAGRPGRWSCAWAWPTTRSCWPRSAGSWVTGSSSCDS